MSGLTGVDKLRSVDEEDAFLYGDDKRGEQREERDPRKRKRQSSEAYDNNMDYGRTESREKRSKSREGGGAGASRLTTGRRGGPGGGKSMTTGEGRVRPFSRS